MLLYTDRYLPSFASQLKRGSDDITESQQPLRSGWQMTGLLCLTADALYSTHVQS